MSRFTKQAPLLAFGFAFALAGCFDTTGNPSGKPHEGAGAEERGPKTETSTNGAFTKGPEIRVSERIEKQAPAGALGKSSAVSAWVGFVPKISTTAPDCQYPTLFRWDDEDGGDNNNQLVWGSTNLNHYNAALGGFAHTWSQWIGGGNSEMRSCQEYVSSLPALSFDYAVLSFSDACPDGSYKFAKRMDNEDYNNHNYSLGWPYPSVVSSGSGGYSWIYFCFRPSAAGAPVTPPANWQSKYFLFTAANANAPYATKGYYYNDDEDSNNNNQWTTTAPGFTPRMQAIIPAGNNTRWNFASWGASPQIDMRGKEVGQLQCFFNDPLWGNCSAQ
jgi:hypothetical protein